MRTTDVVTQARSLDPTSQEDFDGFATSPEGQQLLQNIVSTAPHIARAPRRRGVVAALIATAVVASAGAVAAAVALNQPDAKQAQQVQREHSQEATVHLQGWRPELRAEAVTCLFSSSAIGSGGISRIETTASEFPLNQRLTYNDLARECAQGNDLARIYGPFSVKDTKACVDTSGNYPEAMVAVGDNSCPSGARPMDDADLDELNRMRAIEVAVLAVPSDRDCPTSAQASNWAQEELAHYGVTGFAVTVVDEGEGCYRGETYWHQGDVLVQKEGNQK